MSKTEIWSEASVSSAPTNQSVAGSSDTRAYALCIDTEGNLIPEALVATADKNHAMLVNHLRTLEGVNQTLAYMLELIVKMLRRSPERNKPQ